MNLVRAHGGAVTPTFMPLFEIRHIFWQPVYSEKVIIDKSGGLLRAMFVRFKLGQWRFQAVLMVA